MSIAIAIRFLAGKFHATPWNHQVNEGIVEWPPSPWRVLRALVAAAYQSRNPPSREALCNLVTKLSQSLPCYVLPPCQAAHTRHFMPVWKEGQATTTKVFDTFLALGDGALSESAQVIVSWLDVQLVQNEIELLQQLCRQINYFGRAESWAEMTVPASRS
jgi:CRISPR-associated protein Csb2